MKLHTGKRITRARVTVVPLPRTVKEAVEDMALREGITSIKFTNERGIEIPHVDDERGVDYDEAYDQSEDEDDKNYETDSEEDVDLNADTSIDEDEMRDILVDQTEKS